MIVKKTPSARKEESGKRLPQAVKPVSRKISRKISKAQKVQLDIIAQTNFNFCEGKRIAELLKENRRMWRSALMPLNLISLRDMDGGLWHADTLYLYAEESYQYALEELVREQFQADEIHWIGGSSAVDLLGTSEDGLAQKSSVILSVWWD